MAAAGSQQVERLEAGAYKHRIISWCATTRNLSAEQALAWRLHFMAIANWAKAPRRHRKHVASYSLIEKD
jgi:hypothetical protein